MLILPSKKTKPTFTNSYPLKHKVSLRSNEKLLFTALEKPTHVYNICISVLVFYSYSFHFLSVAKHLILSLFTTDVFNIFFDGKTLPYFLIFCFYHICLAIYIYNIIYAIFIIYYDI